MFRVTPTSGLVHIFSDDSYFLPAAYDFDLNKVMKAIEEHKTESGISLLLETHCCEIEKAFKLYTFLNNNKIRTKVVLKGCCGSFATILALLADSFSMLPGALCLPIDPTNPRHAYPYVYDPFALVVRHLNPSEFKTLFSFLEEVIPHYSKQVQDEIVLSVGKNNLEATERRRKEIRDLIVHALQPKGIKAINELADFLTLDCGGFEHWISRRKFEEFGFELSCDTSFVRDDTVEPIILSADDQGTFDNKLAPLYQNVAALLNSHVLVIKRNTSIDFNLLKKCSELLWLNRNSFGDKNLTVLLDSFGGSEPNAFALTEVLKDFFPNYQVVVTQDARSSATIFCICSPKVLYRKNSLFGCFGASVADYYRSGVTISESFIREGLKKINSEEIRSQMIRNLFKVIHPIQIAQVKRAELLIRELVVEVNKNIITPRALDFFTQENFPHDYPLTAEEVIELLPSKAIEEVPPELEEILRELNGENEDQSVLENH